MLSLSFGFQFQDLYSTQGLSRLDKAFLTFLPEAQKELLQKMRSTPHAFLEKEKSNFLLELIPFFEAFLSTLFQIDANNLKKTYTQFSPIARAHKLFIQRKLGKNIDLEAIDSYQPTCHQIEIDELQFAQNVLLWLEQEAEHQKELEEAKQYALWAIFTKEGQKKYAHSALFKLHEKLDFENLLHHVSHENGLYKGTHLRPRDGFHLTDQGLSQSQAFGEAQYCIFCHNQGKDSCSKGYKEKNSEAFQKNPLGVSLTGCPLEEKISEMNQSVSEGFILGALAFAMIDNPLLPLTGHRICNECMKSCIYQKQEPVNIPGIETKILRDVLGLPWGVEVYSLLTRWNPLNLERPLPKAPTGRDILVVGMGPAGINLSHHLINEGHSVFSIDGLKIEPFEIPFSPIYSFSSLEKDLDDRIIEGFGGVAEYGITIRWDKNFLKLVRLILERRDLFTLKGGVRLGSNITISQAFDLGFDHIALAMGAGKPKLVPLKNNMAKGMRMASDFLMSLQLTGAGQKKSLSNLSLELPALVIGGGLTAIDTATEAFAYYPRQVEKFLERYEDLGEDIPIWSEEEKPIVTTWLKHGRLIRQERLIALEEGRKPNFIPLVQKWGGVTILYRRSMQESPAYTMNHEEISKALEEGIFFQEKVTPSEVVLDKENHVIALKVEKEGLHRTIPARSIFIAAGTQPNIVIQEEFQKIEVENGYFIAKNLDGQKITPEKTSKPKEPGIFTYTHHDQRRISFFGDLHPSFSGNVVKAMASAKRGYPLISKHLEGLPKRKKYMSDLNNLLKAEIEAINRLTSNIIELVVKSPLAAKNFAPGQFYRFQNFEKNAKILKKTSLATEGIALTGSWVDKQKGLVGLITLEMGGSSSLCHLLQKGEEVLLMGPVGEPTFIPENKNVLLIGGGLGNAVLFSIGKALKEKGSKVLYAAGYKSLEDRYKIEQIKEASDYILWCCDESPGFAADRESDVSFVGNIVQGLLAYAKGELGPIPLPLSEIDHVIVIGSDRMMAAVKEARHSLLKKYFKNHSAIASVNSPMQCMMKEICAQCLQKQIDPQTGEERFVFSCKTQDQKLDFVDFDFLNDRLCQNKVQEKLSAAWIAKYTEIS